MRRHAAVEQRPDGTWTLRVPALDVTVSADSEPAAWAALQPAITSLVDDPEGRRRLDAFAAAHGEDATDDTIDLAVADALAPLPRIDAETLDRAVEAGDPVLVVFWADWASSCRDLGPELVALAGELAGRAQLAKLNVDEHPSAATAHRVRGVPTVLLFRQGREARRIVGLRPRDQLLAALEPALP